MYSGRIYLCESAGKYTARSHLIMSNVDVRTASLGRYEEG